MILQVPLSQHYLVDLDEAEIIVLCISGFLNPYLEDLPGDSIISIISSPGLSMLGFEAVPEHVNGEENVVLLGQPRLPEVNHQLPEGVRGAAHIHQ